MKSVLRATAILGSSSIVSILVGLVSAKAWAVLLGPSGLGFMGLLQALVGLASMIASMSIGVGLVRMGTNALAKEDHAQVAALHRAAWLLTAALGCLAVIILAVFSTPISQWVLGKPEHAGTVVLLGLALLFNQGGNLQVGILNTYHRIGALARASILTSLLGVGTSLAMAWLWHERGILPAIIAGTAVSWAVSGYFVRREVKAIPARPVRAATLKAARTLLRFGVPYTGSMLIGTAVQLILPVTVLHALGAESVGYYRAALAVSVNYLGFLLIAMGQDYYPRLAAVSDQPIALGQLVNQQYRLVILLGVPVILATLALAPYLVPLVYSYQFSPAVDVLEWYLIGDVVKFSSWTIGFVIVARCGGSTFFLTELIAGVNLVATSWLGMHWFGLAGLGIGFVVTYIVHYVVVSMIVKREIGLVLRTENKLMMLGASLAALVILLLPAIGLGSMKTPVAFAFALLAGLGSLYTLWLETGGIRSVRAWRQSA